MAKITTPQRFWKLLDSYKKQIQEIYLLAFFIGIISLSFPVGIQAIINFIQIGELTTSWLILVALVVLGIAASGILQVLQMRIVENIQQDIFAKSAIDFGFRFARIKNLTNQNLNLPELSNRFFDVLTIQKGLPKILIDFSISIFQIIFGIILLSIYSSYFMLFGVILIFVMWLIFRITGPKGLETSVKESSSKYDLAYWLEGIAKNATTFQLFWESELHLEKTDQKLGEFLKHRESHFHVLINQFRYFIAFRSILAASFLILGGFLIFSEKMNIGQFVSSEIIVVLLLASVEKIVRASETIYDVLTALYKIGYVADLPLEDYPDPNKNKLEIDRFKFENRIEISAQNLILEEKDTTVFNFNLKQGEKKVVSGLCDHKKNRMLSALIGLHKPFGGQIEYNDIGWDSLDNGHLQKHMGIFVRRSEIFQGSILENITVGRKYDPSQLQTLVEKMQLEKYLNKLPLGLDTVIEDLNENLPEHVIGKIKLVRALLGKPKILLLEEPLLYLLEPEKSAIAKELKSFDGTLLVFSEDPLWTESNDVEPLTIN
ncbi:MAG: ABC transporter ATP-binding protein [Flavobacteriaceae bacterium]|nr:MAG: ABC transporter ATP-binding protein [Flavobacteriaceae bacterium]